MAAEDKINEADRWIDKLKHAYPNQQEVEDNLSAFLSASNSIENYLLEDYNNKYNLGIPFNEKLYAQKFEEKARSQKNINAITFISWFRQKKASIESDPVGSKFTNKRHLDVHRSKQKPDHINITINETIGISDSVTVRAFPANMSAEEALKITREESEREQKELQNKSKQEQSQNASSSQVDLYFQDVPHIKVPDACEKFLNLMKNLVSEARTKFP